MSSGCLSLAQKLLLLLFSILSRLIRVPCVDVPRSCTSTPSPYLTISSCVSVCMSRYWARGKFGEHERGVRVARGLRDVTRSINLVFPFQWRSLCHAHWIHPHLVGSVEGGGQASYWELRAVTQELAATREGYWSILRNVAIFLKRLLDVTVVRLIVTSVNIVCSRRDDYFPSLVQTRMKK